MSPDRPAPRDSGVDHGKGGGLALRDRVRRKGARGNEPAGEVVGFAEEQGRGIVLVRWLDARVFPTVSREPLVAIERVDPSSQSGGGS